MIRHAMAYVQMADKVREELFDIPAVVFPWTVALGLSQKALIDAERQLVHAYSTWRDAMQEAADAGSTRAAEYLKRTTWDLT